MQHQLLVQIVVDVGIFAVALAGCVVMAWANGNIRQPDWLRRDGDD
jgi:hypothetical protein